MMRKIIKIDEGKCNGCGLCVEACHEEAIGMVNGKAKLLRDDYCDGLGDCLPTCPTNAISFEYREAAEYDEAAVKANMEAKKAQKKTLACGCPGSQSKSINREVSNSTSISNDIVEIKGSQLNQWPVQIKLVPTNASYLKNASLLIAADCTAYAYGNFHNKFMKNKVTLIGCPKLDEVDYAEKLTEILKENDIKNIVVTRMEVPCCGGIVNAVKTALQNSGKMIPWQIVTISVDGKIVDGEI
ncbi:iron-sulfur binding protein [Clostridioides difficile]|uniref:Iron-sulfur binding protein n=5 Tax=Clostridioides difficile TaxID=1496 RepID=A0A9R0BL90_CLODR|nr:4Fe-4S binding protein [Clostridioides difficile]EQG57146.1 4Fe-4S binding domain protein [Clostridioides difficile DA00145]EQH99811.1 4Fe-4S binding domain protein [Clostridioides difficile F314]EQI05239.1 4Fe-4S binding domain protein [Clostridioides difficile F253]EQJ40652.1 4Fe-4S binding domain protein [Clostridioides difficile P23]EQJ79354.1 4Fe-4S binding domain protein [Clostridioides difficile P45]EQK05050.1 4Fe-4S binding domain protein [Clostridioides difficile P59]EQK87865.1 4